MSPGGPLSIWDMWDKSTRWARNAGLIERENRLTAERGSSGRMGQMDAKCPNRPVRAEISTRSPKAIGTHGTKGRELAEPAEKGQVNPKQSGTSGPKMPEPAESAEMSTKGPGENQTKGHPGQMDRE
ncbi:hypothetical protein KI387_034938, partial [Taxus chinensis]